MKYFDDKFIEKIDDIFNNLHFLDSNDSLLFEIVVNAYEYCFLNGGSVNYLLKICQLYSRKFKEIHKDIERISLMALKKTEHSDSIVYNCLSVIHNYDHNEAITKLQQTKLLCKNPNNIALILVFEAALHWRKGDFVKYIALLRSFFKDKELNFNPYMAIPCSTVWLSENSPCNTPFVEDRDLFKLYQKLELKDVFENYEDIDYIVSVSCDSKYYEKYAPYFVESLNLSGDKFICFVSIADHLEKIPENIGNKFILNEFHLKRTSNIGPISSALRYLTASKISAIVKKPIIIMDFDSVVKGSLVPLIERHHNSTLALRFLEKNKCLPWQYITAGFGIFYSNNIAKAFLSNVEAFLYHSLELDGEQWWIDQNSLEVASRFVDMRSVSNLFWDLPNYAVIPTGSQNAKLTQLSVAMKSIPDLKI